MADPFKDIAGPDLVLPIDTTVGKRPSALPYRGDWTPGTLYNGNDIVRYVGADDVPLLLLSTSTHVAGSDINFDLWGLLIDLKDIQDGVGVTPLDDLVAQTLLYATSVDVIPGTDKKGALGYAIDAQAAAALAARNATDLTNTGTELVSQASANALVAGQAADEVQLVKIDVNNAKADAILYATGDPNVIIDPVNNFKSARGYAQDAKQAVSVYLLSPVVYIDDPATGSGAFEIVASTTWVGQKIICRNTRALTIRLPPNFNRTVWPLNNADAASFFRVQRVGTGTVTIAGAGSGDAVFPAISADQYNQGMITTPVAATTVRTYRILAKAGTQRWFACLSMHSYTIQDALRNTTLTATLTGGGALTIAEPVPDTATGAALDGTGPILNASMFLAQMPDSSVDQDLDYIITFPNNLQNFGQYAAVVSNGATVLSSPVGFSENVNATTYIDVSLNISRAGTLALLGMGKRTKNADPVSWDKGVIRASGIGEGDPLVISGGNFNSYSFGYDANLAVELRRWRAQFSGTAHRGAGLGIFFEPGVASATVVIRAPAAKLAPAANETVTVEAMSDGRTFDVS